MSYIEDGKLDKLVDRSNKEVIDLYLNRYMSFFARFAAIDLPFDPKIDGIASRKADRALSKFGQYVGRSSQTGCP
jgi:hypothetical protein